MNAVLETLRSLDVQLFLFVQKIRVPAWDIVFSLLTELGGILFALCLGLCFLLYRENSRKAIALEVWSIGFVSFNVAGFLKRHFQILRPYEVLGTAHLVDAQGYSFPSGHAMMAFVLATVLSSHFCSLRVLFFGMAVAVGFSRVYVGVHYPSDVVIGSVAGYFLAKAIQRVVFGSSRAERK